jgi:hypothetical protein
LAAEVTNASKTLPFHKGLKADKWDGRISESQSLTDTPDHSSKRYGWPGAVPYPGQNQKPQVIGFII